MVEELAPGIPLVAAPWIIQGESWIYPIYTPFSSTPIPLPTAAYSPFERRTTFDLSARFHGGVGMVIIVRYKDCPAGPYDELLYLPGLFSTVVKPKDYFLSNTRAYVSTDVSVANGRKEWGIPKHRADFTFTPSPSDPSKIHLTVSHPSSSSSTETSFLAEDSHKKPFFSAILVNSRITPFSLPVSTNWLNWRLSKWLIDGYECKLLQPPLVSSSTMLSNVDDGDNKKDDEEEKINFLKRTNQRIDCFLGTNGQSLLFEPTSKGYSRLSYLERVPNFEQGQGEGGSFGDGIGFPRFEVAKEGILKGRGVHLESFTMDIPKQKVFDSKSSME